MDDRGNSAEPSLHQVLAVFPMTLFAAAASCDAIALLGGKESMSLIAFWLMAGGIIGGLATVPFGVLDLLAIPRHDRAWALGLAHGLVTLVVLVLFAASWRDRASAPERPGLIALLLSFTGVASALVGGWLGAEVAGRFGPPLTTRHAPHRGPGASRS